MRRRLPAALGAVAWMALLFAASSVPGSGMPSLGGLSYALHAGTHAVLGGLVLMALLPSGRPSGRACALAFALVLAHGLADEWHQSFVPGRHPSALDVVADGLGGLAGVLALRAFRRAAPAG